jgi:Apea-like HEPN
MAPRHLRHADAARKTLLHDAGLVLAQPSPATASARDQFDPPHLRDAAAGSGRLAFKLTLKRNVKIIAHGSALRHNPDTTETWEGSPAYAKAAILEIPNFVGRFGTGAAERIVLQLIYQYFERAAAVQYDEAQFKQLWCDFIAEVQDAYWIARGVANLRNFQSQANRIDLGDGVTIRGRSQTDLASLGFEEAVWKRISEDWGTPGPSSFVLVAEYCFAKQPDNLIVTDAYNPSLKATRAIGALRLLAPGAIGIGPMWLTRAARFNVGIGGLSSTGTSIPMYGSAYHWSDEVQGSYPALYDALTRLEKEGYGKSPGNLQIALRSFISSYDRWPAFPDSRLLDLITSLEALLGSETEIAFRLSFRVAALLAPDDQQRGDLLKLVKGFYDTRSRIVHGGALGKKHQDRLQHIETLAEMVRRLLRAFVGFAIAPVSGYEKSFWQEDLDAALLDAAKREKLREALKLSQSTHPPADAS